MLTSSELRQNEWNKEGRDKKKVNIPYLDTNGLKRESRMEGNKGCEAHHLKSKESLKAGLRGEVKVKAFKEGHQHLGVQYRPHHQDTHYHLASGCVSKGSIRFGINGYCGSLVTDRISLHYTVIVTSVLR